MHMQCEVPILGKVVQTTIKKIQKNVWKIASMHSAWYVPQLITKFKMASGISRAFGRLGHGAG